MYKSAHNMCLNENNLNFIFSLSNNTQRLTHRDEKGESFDLVLLFE